MKLGSVYNDNGTTSFTVWAPKREKVTLQTVFPQKMSLPLMKQEYGYYHIANVKVQPGTRYFYQLDNDICRPDPVSRFQPEGVHGPSEVISTNFEWHDKNWNGITLEKMIIYEIHVGTFTKNGTFDGIIEKIPHLRELGITAIEIMPVAQFPGGRNWGYDGTYHYAVQNSYGGPDGLKRLVDACHKNEIAVVMDVVYNHFGPEGAYVNEYGYYFTDKYQTPWGKAINFDDAWSDGVRNYFIQNALEWYRDYHIDAIRLDAIHSIFDFGGKHFLRELAEKVEQLSIESGWKRLIIAESDLNDIRVISPFELNGYGLDAQWHDDFHHSIIALITGERKSYYGDFGSIECVKKAYSDGFVYSWKYSENRKRYHGTSSVNFPGKQFVVCIQNHDQVGNRLLGERVSTLVSFDALKLLAGALLVSPYIPLLFMGEEFAVESPFIYFISHGDENLVKAVRIGRTKEFLEMHGELEAPDPQDQKTFEKCKIDWEQIHQKENKIIFNFYKKLIQLRKNIQALSRLSKNNLSPITIPDKNVLIIERVYNGSKVICLMNFSGHVNKIEKGLFKYSGQKIIDSSEQEWGGSGSRMQKTFNNDSENELMPYQFVLYNEN